LSAADITFGCEEGGDFGFLEKRSFEEGWESVDAFKKRFVVVFGFDG